MSGLVSILMGVFNCENTLESAVDSILKQTYNNWELIICDDSSTDDTYMYAKSLSKNDSRIKVIRNEKNLTLAPTLNRCLELANGEYIARMDGDDTCSPNRLEKEINFLNNNPDYSVVSCRMNMYDDDGIFRTTNVNLFPQKKDLVKGTPFCHAGCLMRTDVLRELNGYDIDKKVERVEDYDLWYRLYLAGYKGANIDEALYNMRDDVKAIKRRKFKYRVNGFRLKIKIVNDFKLAPYYYLYAFKPLIIGLLPIPIYRMMHRHG